MTQVYDKSEAGRLELEKREIEHLLSISARARGVIAECNRVLATRRENLNCAEAAEFAALVRS